MSNIYSQFPKEPYTTPTPRTDRESMPFGTKAFVVDSDFARELEREVERLKEELQDIKDGMKFIMDEKCADSEVHCGCVPMLKISFKDAEAEVARLRELLNRAIEIADNYKIAGLPRDGFMWHWKVNKHEFSMLKEKIRLATAPEETNYHHESYCRKCNEPK